MPDGPFKGMAPDPDSDKNVDRTKYVECEVCGGKIRTGDWPSCRGNPAEHLRS